MLLALDTATNTASIALYDRTSRTILGEQTWQAHRRQTEELLPALHTMMAQQDHHPDEISAIAITTGPGSFTGVRIGISVVKGLAMGLPSLPQLVGVPTLCVTAAPWLVAAHRADPRTQVWAVIQAGRGRFNWVAFSAKNPEQALLWRPAVGDHHVGRADKLGDALATADHPIWLTGELSQAVEQAAERHDHVYLIDGVDRLRRAGQLARLGALHLAQGNGESIDTLQPLYLREPG